MKEFKKAFLTGVGGFLGVISIPAGIFVLLCAYALLKEPIIKVLQKQSYSNWIKCESSIAKKTVNQAYDEGYKGKAMTNRINQLREDACGEKPEKWKWQ